MIAAVMEYGLGDVISTLVLALAGGLLAALAYKPAGEFLLAREVMFDRILRQALLLDIKPRVATWISIIAAVLVGLLAAVLLRGVAGFFLGFAAGAVLPGPVLKLLRRKRVAKLDRQLVSGIQSLASGVRAGLNLVQAMQLIARDGPNPMRQEFRHLLREYEYGVPLDQAMSNAATRIGSGDYRLLFAALHTHRERGGNLGETLDRISESIREIQRLEKTIETHTAQGRTTARWLGMMPIVVLAILYVIQRSYVITLIQDGLGNVIIAIIVVLNLIGFLWVRKIMAIDI